MFSQRHHPEKREGPTPEPEEEIQAPSPTSLERLQEDFGNTEMLDAATGESPELLEDLMALIARLPTEHDRNGPHPPPPRAMRSARSGGNRATDTRPPLTGGEPLPAPIRARMEAVFGRDFGHVRLHRGAAAADAAEQLDATAATIGSHLFFAPGAWAPGTAAGDQLIAHELAHVVQHDQGQVPDDGSVSEPADDLERAAADAADAAATALAGAPAPGEAGATAATPPSASPGAQILCDRYPHTPEALDDYAERLTAMGLRGMDRAALAPLTGDPHDDALTPSEIETAFTTLEEAGSGVARGWNGDQDDLGPRTSADDRDHAYWTPLHYGLALHRLAVESGASGYADFVRHRAAQMTLAGAPMQVHPRAVWFVAAAQVGMDRAAGVEEGEHYAAPAALTGATRRLRRTLSALARIRIPRLTDRSPAPRRAAVERLDRTLPERYRDARAELAEIQAIAELHQGRDTAADTAGEGREQPEAFAAWLLAPERQSAIAAIADPTNATEAIAAAARLDSLLEGAPGRAHGMGATDAHGTAHAMGMAIDYGTSAASGAENRGVPDAVWPFLYQLMDDSGPPLAGQRPHAIHAMDHEHRALLSDLVRGPQGRALYERLSAEETEGEGEGGPSPAERRGLRRSVQALQMQARTTLRQLLARVDRLGRGPTASLRAEVTDLHARIREDLRTMGSRSPSDIADLLDDYRPTLQELDEQIRDAYQAEGDDERAWLERRMTSHEPGPAPASVRRRRSRRRRMSPEESFDADVAAVRAALADIDRTRDAALLEGTTDATASGARTLSEGPAQQQWEHDREAALRQLVRSGVFRRWWQGAQRTGIYNQPDAYVAGIESVHAHADGGSHFYGGHHWDIANMRVVTDDGEYRASLDRDMERRSPENIDRIVHLLDESASGRQALDSDGILGAALEQHAPGWRSRRAAAGGDAGEGGAPGASPPTP